MPDGSSFLVHKDPSQYSSLTQPFKYLKQALLLLNQNCFGLDLFINVEHCENLTVLGKPLELFIGKSAIVFIPKVNKPRWSGH